MKAEWEVDPTATSNDVMIDVNVTLAHVGFWTVLINENVHAKIRLLPVGRFCGVEITADERAKHVLLALDPPG